MPSRRSDIDVDSNASSLVEDALSTKNATMADFQPYVKSYYGPSVVAYPSSLEVFDVIYRLWYWNASCWISYRQLDTVETNQIIIHTEKHLGYEWAAARKYCMLHLGTDINPNTGCAPSFSTFIVFPKADKLNAYNGGFGKCSEDLMQAWTDEVMIPSVESVFGRDGSRTAAIGRYELIRLNSLAARVERMCRVPDTPISVPVRGDELKAPWANMQRVVAEKRLTETEDMFLIIVAGEAERGLQIPERSWESFWNSFSQVWDGCINMNFVPAETVHIAAKGYYGLK